MKFGIEVSHDHIRVDLEGQGHRSRLPGHKMLFLVYFVQFGTLQCSCSVSTAACMTHTLSLLFLLMCEVLYNHAKQVRSHHLTYLRSSSVCPPCQTLCDGDDDCKANPLWIIITISALAHICLQMSSVYGIFG